jgi:hypothetical protein
MSSAGHVFDMIARMKANAQRKRRPFDREVQASGPAIRPEYLRQATEAELEHWRQRMAMERRVQQRRERIILAVIVLVFLALFIFS